MSIESLVRLRWHGSDTAQEVIRCIEEKINVEIEFAANFHHTCYRRLYPNADSGEPETIDLEGDAELIRKLATIGGLEDLECLADPISRAGARVIMKSPIPRIYIGFEFNKKRSEFF